MPSLIILIVHPYLVFIKGHKPGSFEVYLLRSIFEKLKCITFHWSYLYFLITINSNVSETQILLATYYNRVPTLPGKPGILSFLFQDWKMPGICSKSSKTWNFNLKSGKTWNLQILYFKLHFSRCHYKNNSDLLLCYIYIINTNTDSKPNWPWISLLLLGNNLENTWNFVLQEKWEPCICFNTFWDLYN